jgi:predicted  nucleic acid-binding Zn-ribbon protein
MNQSLLKLVEMQEIDLKIHELDVSSREFPAQVAAIEAEIGAATEAVAAAKRQVEQVTQERSSARSAIDSGKTALERSQSRLSTITTNREYDAVHAEISASQQAMSNAEKRLGAIDGDETKANAVVDEAEARLKKVQEEQGPLLADLREKIASIDSKRQVLVAQRNVIAPTVSPQFLRTYEHILKKRKSGIALSYVDSRERLCTVCHRVLEAQRANELQAAKRLSICESCGSIMVWRDLASQTASGAAPETSAQQ